MSYLDKDTLKVVGTRPIRPDGVDKVIGRANFGADMVMPGMLWGKIKRSPHAHARIMSINTDKAMALPGVKAVVTARRFPRHRVGGGASSAQAPMNFRDLSRNCMARGKVLYEGHAVAAVAATSPAIAEEALDLIEVEYEVLPHVIDVEDGDGAGRAGAARRHLHPGRRPEADASRRTSPRWSPSPRAMSTPGSREAEVVDRAALYDQAGASGLYRAACLRRVGRRPTGRCTIWSSSQGQFMVRAYCAKLLGIDIANIRAIPAEIGGGFGGKTIVYLEPVAWLLSKKSGRPVKIVMSREEVFRGTGPASGGVVEVKLGAKKDGTDHRRRARAQIPGGRLPGLAGRAGLHVRLCGVRHAERQDRSATTSCRNRPKVAAYRAPGAPNRLFGVESCVDELARELGIDPLQAARDQRAPRTAPRRRTARPGTISAIMKTLEAAKAHPHLKVPLGPNQGRGIASGFWFNIGGESSAACHVNEDGTVSVVEGNPDIGGSRASMAMMVAEVLGIPFEQRAPDRRRHQRRSASSLPDRRQPRHLRDRHGGDAGRRKGRRRAEEARRDDLGHQPRRGRMEGRQGLPGRPQRRQLRAAVDWPRSRSRPARTGGPISAEVSDQRARRRRRALRPISATSRSTGRPATSRSCAIPRSRMSAARSTPPMSRARSRAA